MSEYRTVEGIAVKDNDEDAGIIEGQVYYDTDANEFKLKGAGGVEALDME